MNDVRARLQKTIAQALVDRNISPDSIVGTDLGSELSLTSVDALEILIWTETEFDIEIPDEDLSGELLVSLDSLEAYVEGHLAARR
jgi:acyl carrier protein